MAPQQPMLFLDSIVDRVTLYPNALVTASSELVGREVRRLSDYRRERTWWQPADDGAGNTPQGNWIDIDLGVGGTDGTQTLDYLWLDRFSNVFGQTVRIQTSDDHVTWPGSQYVTLPGATVVGGDPSSGTCTVTEESCAYAIFAGILRRRYARVFFPYTSGFIPVVTGLMLGTRIQFLGFPSSGNDDDKARTANTATSDAGYMASARTYAWRVPKISMKLIGRAEYDAVIRTVERLMFSQGQPAVYTQNWGDYPERSALYLYDGSSWAAPLDRTTRTITLPLRECGASILGG